MQPGGGQQLLKILDAAMAEAARRSGDWVVCRPGCTDCCRGPFPITPLDALRLRAGLAALEPALAAKVVERARASTNLGDDDFCPALDPTSGNCDLYDFRPVTCRLFGPAVMLANGELGVCDLCYQGASDAGIAACAVTPDPDGVEAALLSELGTSGETTVAAALTAA